MIIITGAAGFIGSAMVAQLQAQGHKDLVLVDDFSRADKRPNWAGRGEKTVERSGFEAWLAELEVAPEAIVHLGARTDTTEQDKAIFDRLNLAYSKMVWKYCVAKGVALVYASSAATYGDGELGFVDDHALFPDLKPMNPYGESKQDFDLWALSQDKKPPFWAGMKFFNVYGPNEYHKGRMASVVLHAFRQIGKTGKLKLFRSHRDGYFDGHQSRDFIYVKDVVKVMAWFLENREMNGIFNLGTGKARKFLDLGRSVFKAMGLEAQIEFIDTPVDIRDTYQYFTEASMGKLRRAGFKEDFTSLENGVEDYVQNYLQSGSIF